jgi:hypothetical protein
MRQLVQAACAALAGLICAGAAPAQQTRTHEPIVISAPAGTRVIRPAATSAPRAATASATTAPAAASAPATATAPQPAGLIFTGSTGGDSVQTLLNGNVGVPGLGFDFTHHAAVNRNLDTMALIDPLTQHRLALARQIRRETPRAVAFPVFSQVTQVVVMQQPPVIIFQPPAEPPAEPLERIRYVEREPVPAVPPPPVRELENLVFVLRDGTTRLARAFMTNGQRIVYITPEGIRRTLSLAELDPEATLEANEERGTTLHIPL